MRGLKSIPFLILSFHLVGCGGEITSFSAQLPSNETESTPGDDESKQSNPQPSTPIPDQDIKLDTFGEQFQKSIATRLEQSRYMEKNCQSVSSWSTWKDLPMKWCRYQTKGQSAEVLMLNPGPRRLTQWLQDACSSLSGNFNNCMEKSFKQILYQSGGQFPVAGVVIEDMDGNGKGNAYAFRNGVTIRVSAFSTGTEQILSSSLVSRAFTDPAMYTYTYGRPISITREQLSSYGRAHGLDLPNLGSSSERKNIYNEVMAELYQNAWHSQRNHILRAWIYAQNF